MKSGFFETFRPQRFGATPLNSYTSHKRYCYHIELKEIVKSKFSVNPPSLAEANAKLFVFRKLL